MSAHRTPARVLGPAALGVLAVAGVLAAAPASAATVPALGYAPDDAGSMSSITRIVGAQAAWASGITGAGIDVAVIDTGVTPVAGLDAPGKVVTGPDLSFDAPGATTPGLDAFGHGTFMASLIAGRDAGVGASPVGCTTCLNGSGFSDTSRFVGVAPGARIVDVKVGAADGASDVTQVIAALDWVTQHAHDPGMNIRVISLSYGTTSTQPYTVDPLAEAAEQAWKHGIVVVAAAGNEGHSAPTLADPAYDPYLVAVGGDDPRDTLVVADDKVPSFAEHGTQDRPVDLVAPAVHVLGLRVPGSFVDTQAGNTGQVGTRFQRGSGTSEATAIVSGVAALVAQRYPDATPDQVKALLSGTANPLMKGASTDPVSLHHAGHGVPDAGLAVATTLPAAGVTAQPFAASTGTGPLDGTRAGMFVTDNGVALTGQQDIFGHPFSSAAMAQAQVRAAAWSGGTWNGGTWSGAGWSGSRWSSVTWTGSDWSGSRWSGSRWSGMSWDGSRWSGSGWSSSRWSGSGWDSSRWSGSTWA